MSIVRGDHEAVCQMDQIILPCVTEAVMNPCKRIIKEGGRSALFGRAAHFFAVQYAVHGKMSCFLPGKEPLKCGKGALEVVQPSAGDELLRSSPYACFLPVIEKKIVTEDSGFFSVSRFGEHFHKCSF